MSIAIVISCLLCVGGTDTVGLTPITTDVVDIDILFF